MTPLDFLKVYPVETSFITSQAYSTLDSKTEDIGLRKCGGRAKQAYNKAPGSNFHDLDSPLNN